MGQQFRAGGRVFELHLLRLRHDWHANGEMVAAVECEAEHGFFVVLSLLMEHNGHMDLAIARAPCSVAAEPPAHAPNR